MTSAAIARPEDGPAAFHLLAKSTGAIDGSEPSLGAA
jgi:hypothetical protein